MPLCTALLERCRRLSSQWEVPRHLYSHLQGTFMDAVLERVDSCAKDLARRQQPTLGWIAGLQDPMVCFFHHSTPGPYQLHDPWCCAHVVSDGHCHEMDTPSDEPLHDKVAVESIARVVLAGGRDTASLRYQWRRCRNRGCPVWCAHSAGPRLP